MAARNVPFSDGLSVRALWLDNRAIGVGRVFRFVVARQITDPAGTDADGAEGRTQDVREQGEGVVILAEVENVESSSSKEARRVRSTLR